MEAVRFWPACSIPSWAASPPAAFATVLTIDPPAPLANFARRPATPRNGSDRPVTAAPMAADRFARSGRPDLIASSAPCWPDTAVPCAIASPGLMSPAAMVGTSPPAPCASVSVRNSPAYFGFGTYASLAPSVMAWPVRYSGSCWIVFSRSSWVPRLAPPRATEAPRSLMVRRARDRKLAVWPICSPPARIADAPADRSRPLPLSSGSCGSAFR